MADKVRRADNWRDIPGYDGKYRMNELGEVQVFYKYKGHSVCPHYELRKLDGGSILLYKNKVGTKYCIDYLYELVFGVQHIESLDGEVWKPVQGYEGYYKISNKGRLLAERRFLTRKGGVTQFCKEQIVKAGTIINSGYKSVNLIKDKKLKHALIHRLVAQHFVDNPNGFDIVNHKDENKLNNVADNLEWCSHKYNSNYGTSNERRIASRLRNNNGRYGYQRKVNRV